jgi:hypothetical protein
MTHPFDLLARTLRREAPLRMLLYAGTNKVHCWLKTGDRRHEFNRIFLQDADPWDYAASPCERRKDARTLEAILHRRARAQSVLEVGCSMFTAMLAGRA